MVTAVYMTSLAAAATFTVPPPGNAIIWIAAVLAGIVAWRWKRGDFYKSIAEEKAAQIEQLRELLARRPVEDITPILDALKGVTIALQRSTAMSDTVVAKVEEMNGSLRAHGEAMKALADHLILDEASRGLLKAAADKPATPRRRT